MFTIQDRDLVRERILQYAESDTRISAGAVVASLALSDGDRWSDLDLTFAVVDTFSMYEVLDDWTQNIIHEFDAAHLFDLPSGPSIYRVFLLPGCLQFDLSFTPASKFGAAGPKFKLLFGATVERPFPTETPMHELFGYAVHHALRARFCIERNRYWQAEYWISATRDYALNIACRRHGLPANHGRGYDQLPNEVKEAFSDSLVRSLEKLELMRALGVVINGLFAETSDVQRMADQIKPQLLELMSDWENNQP